MCDKDSNISVSTDDTDSLIIHHKTCDKSSEECWKCWNFPHIEFKKEVQVLNRKYCWLYPKRAEKKLKELVPGFEHCESLYTRCDYKLEACANEQLLIVESDLKIHEKLFKKEITLQSQLTDQLWELSLRLMILKESGCCIKLYPEVISGPTERRTVCEFHTVLKELKFSNCRLGNHLVKIQASIEELDRRCSLLDMTLQSPFLLGDGAHRPLAYLRQMISDIYNYFYSSLCKLKCWAQLIDPADTPSIEDYSSLLKSLDDFEGFLMAGIEKCTCLRTKKKDCIKRHKPC